jgi:hypothetical protein
MPFQPNVIVAFDESGNPLPPDKLVGPLNVGENNLLRLKSFAGEDISYLQDLTAPQASISEKFDFADLVASAYP